MSTPPKKSANQNVDKQGVVKRKAKSANISNLTDRSGGSRGNSELPSSSDTNLIANAESDLAVERTSQRGERLPYHVDHQSLENSHNQRNMARRYRYYTRLDPGPDSRLRMPDHIVPDRFFMVLPFEEFLKDGKQNSIITIFSIWNTMMGTSLLSMPWAIDKAGIIAGPILMTLMGALAAYTAYRVVQSPIGLNLSVPDPEFSHVCGFFWGKAGEWTATAFSLFVLVGGAIAYWVLMSNFLFYTGLVIYEALETNSTSIISMANKSLTCDVICADEQGMPRMTETSDTGFFRFWKLRLTVPIYLAILAYPLLNFKSPTFFTKFNVFGTISVFYLLVFVTTKSIECGFHISFDPMSRHYTSPIEITFPALTGTLALSYFIHNAILAILRNQEKPENNARDLLIGYALCIITYTFIGFMFYGAFPLTKSCIADNLLNNFSTGDALSVIARLFLLFQMLCVLPLLLYIVRAQLSYAVIGAIYPGLKWVLLLNGAIIITCILFAIYLPSVGSILRYTGAISGLVYIFTLPCLVHLKKLEMTGRSSRIQTVLHYSIIGLGVMNLFGQIALNFLQ